MVHPVDGTYYYYVTLYGCNGEEIELHGPIKLRNNGGIITHPHQEIPRDEVSQEHFENLYPSQLKEIEDQITLFPIQLMNQ